MKHFFLFLSILFLSVACSDENVDDLKYFKPSDIVISLDNKAQSYDVDIDTNTDWNLSNGVAYPEWLTVNKMNDKLLRIEVAENETEEIRFCTIYFEEPNDSCYLNVIQDCKKFLSFKGVKEQLIKARKDSLVINVETNVFYNVKIVSDTDWITNSYNMFLPTLYQNKLILNIDRNKSLKERLAEVIVSNDEYQLSDTLKIKQMPKTSIYISDGEYKLLSKSFKGNTNLIIMGDGFTDEDLDDGCYGDCMNEAMEYFFSIEPFKTYRDYFNVYMVVAESEEEGVGEKNIFGESSIKNKFGTAYGSGTEIVCNDERIFEYARKVKELPEDKPITVLVVLNSDKYAGTAYLYEDGNSIALCPMSTEGPPNDFEGIVHHEAGGHAFGFLCDEYVYNQSEMPEERKKSIKEWQKQGFHLNLDFTNDFEKILWKDFIGMDKYAPVGAYEGGYEYQFGVWRSEENSCMNNNIPYYNVQSRWCIVKRIMELSDIEFTVQDFISNDNPVYPTDGRALNNWDNFVPLGHPIWVKK